MHANGILNMYVDIEIHRIHIKPTSNKTWEALKKQYGTPTAIVACALMHDMNNYKVVDHVRDGKNFPAQLEELQGLITKVHNAGHLIDITQRIIIITEVLPNKWQSMTDSAMVAGIFTDINTTIQLLTQKYNTDQSLKKSHSAMPAKISGLNRYMPKPQKNQGQNQSKPRPSNQQMACTQKNTQKQQKPANVGGSD